MTGREGWDGDKSNMKEQVGEMLNTPGYQYSASKSIKEVA
jgi:hypothetical protein